MQIVLLFTNGKQKYTLLLELTIFCKKNMQKYAHFVAFCSQRGSKY